MAVNKVVFGTVSIIDITDSTVTPETLAIGRIAYDKAGNRIVGTVAGASPATKKYKHTITLNCIVDEDYNYVGDGVIVLINDDPTDYTNEGGGALPDGIIGCTLSVGGEKYTIQAYEYDMFFTMTDGTMLLFDSPGEAYDEVTDYDENSTQLSVTIDGKAYPITAGMTWGEFQAAHDDEFFVDYSGGFGWGYYEECNAGCGDYKEYMVHEVVGGQNGSIFGADGSVALPQLVINPYVTYRTSYSTPRNFIFDLLINN